MTTRAPLLAVLASLLAASLLPSMASAQSEPARIRVRSDGHDLLSLHVREPGAWRMLCIAPCDAVADEGVATLGIARGGGEPAFATVADLEDTLSVRLRYEDRSGIRVIGLVTLLASVAGGLAMGISGLSAGRESQADGLALGTAGIATVTLGGIAGFAMLLHGDIADLSFE